MANVKVVFNMDPIEKILLKRKLNKNGKAQRFFTSEIARLSDPYVPFRQGMLKNTVRVGVDKITYVQPYSKKQWYENKGNGLRGKEWTIRMWNCRKSEIIGSVARYTGGKGR